MFWLWISYKNDRQRLGGIIHLHDITVSRMIPSLQMSLEVFSLVCGHSAYPRIALGTTKWPNAQAGIASPAGPQATGSKIIPSSARDQAESRFNELKQKYWNDFITAGSKTYRIENQESALQLVRSILQELELTAEGGKLILQLQEEVVDKGKGVRATKAGKKLKTGGRKKSSSMTQEEKDAQKVIQKEKKEMDRQLKLLATKKKTVLEWMFGSVCRLFRCWIQFWCHMQKNEGNSEKIKGQKA